MSGLRFSIANLFAAVAIICGGLAALNSQSGVPAGLLMLATITGILVAVLGVVLCAGEPRAFWLGVAVFGGSYFVVAFSPAFPNVESQLRKPLNAFRRAFWTTKLPEGPTTLPAGKDSGFDESAQAWLSWPAWDGGFGAKIHCLVNLLFALAGGIVGRWFYVTDKRRGDKA
jgi:hypothetical protein